MTREEAKEKIFYQWQDFLEHNIDYAGISDAYKMAIEALEQEPIIDKIRAEIMDTGAYEQETMGQTAFLNGINYCLGVIDKYKAESEDEI